MWKMLRSALRELREVKEQNETLAAQVQTLVSEHAAMHAELLALKKQVSAPPRVVPLAAASSRGAAIVPSSASDARLVGAAPSPARGAGARVRAASSIVAPAASARARLVTADGCSSVFSAGSAHILPFLTMEDACALRLACREMRDAVTAWPWGRGVLCARPWKVLLPRRRVLNVARWRRCFPHARVVRLSIRATDATLAQLVGVRALGAEGCRFLTDAALAPLSPNIYALDITRCTRLTDATLAHLRGIRVLDAAGCAGLIGHGFGHIGADLVDLNISECCRMSLQALAGHLCNLRVLLARFSPTDAADWAALAANLPAIESLDATGSNLGDDALAALAQSSPRLALLNISRCRNVSADGLAILSAYYPHLRLELTV